MRKGKSVIGKQILSLADGARLQTVKDVILGANNESVVGLLADEGGFLASSLVVPIEEVSSFGRDAVVVARRESVIPAKEAPGIASIVAGHQSLLGTRVFTETGDDQGKLNDVYFDEPTGRILGFELSGGVFADAAQGMRYVPVEELVRVGPDVAYVHPETAELLEQQRGGLSGKIGGKEGPVPRPRPRVPSPKRPCLGSVRAGMSRTRTARSWSRPAAASRTTTSNVLVRPTS